MEYHFIDNFYDLTLWLWIISSSNEYVCHVYMQMLLTTLQSYFMLTHEKHAFICLKQDAYVPCARLGGGERGTEGYILIKQLHEFEAIF
jgi:hypothetical protein